MNITSITATIEDGSTMVYGLGADFKVHFWNPEKVAWELWKS